jgi:hypothetical protein
MHGRRDSLDSTRPEPQRVATAAGFTGRGRSNLLAGSGSAGAVFSPSSSTSATDEATDERLVSNRPFDRSGSIAPIRFLKQRPFDQRFARLGSPIFERLLCRFFHCDCDDEQRLLCLEISHSRRKFFWG